MADRESYFTLTTELKTNDKITSSVFEIFKKLQREYFELNFSDWLDDLDIKITHDDIKENIDVDLIIYTENAWNHILKLVGEIKEHYNTNGSTAFQCLLNVNLVMGKAINQDKNNVC